VIANDVPALRIIDQALWDEVKARQQDLKVKQAKDKAGFWDRRRPRYLFSGMMKCGECGGGFVKISEHYFGCATARNKGTCQTSPPSNAMCWKRRCSAVFTIT
jgi:site-specific DNA recombinase